MPVANITENLSRWIAGDREVEAELMTAIYPMLRAMAQKQLSAVGPVTIQATELANEAFIRLRASNAIEVTGRDRFMGLMARLLRNLVVDYLRERGAKKRGGDLTRISIQHAGELAADVHSGLDWLALDAALKALEAQEPEHAKLVELRYFLGLGIDEAAEKMDVSSATANRMWRFARAFLSDHMRQQMAEVS